MPQRGGHAYAGDFPEGLPAANGGTHIGMFLAWAILHDLHGEFHRQESAEKVDLVRRREMTGREFLFDQCDEKFWEEDLSEERNAFAAWYYQGERGGPGPYFEDYEWTLRDDLPLLYFVADTWENYDRIAPVISRRFEEWKARRRAK